MKIWLINPYGPIPGEGWRKYRFAMLAEELAEAGHETTWWTSGFSHHFKVHRSRVLVDKVMSANYKIRLVPTTGYNRNISIGRIIRDMDFSRKVYQLGLNDNDKPDVIIYYESPFSFGYAGQKLAQKLKVPVIFDQVDLWPELIVKAFPAKMRVLMGFLLQPVYNNRKKVYGKLDGIIALAKTYLDVPLNVSPALKTKPHAVIYNGIDIEHFRASSVPVENLPVKQAGDIWVVFAGTLGPTYDILNLLEVSRRFSASTTPVKFIIAGSGPLTTHVVDHVGDSVYYLGSLSPGQLVALYSRCDIGLCAYTTRSNVEMPDKFYDYTAAGLPVINSLTGEVASWVENYEIGLNYTGGSADDLFEKIQALAINEVKRREMATRSFKLGEQFDQKKETKKIHQVLHDVFLQTGKRNDGY